MSLKWNFYKLGELIDLSTGKLDSNAEEKNGSYPFFTCAPDPLKINSYSFNQKAILLAGNNANGNFHINYYEGKFDAYQRTYVIDVLDKERINLKFLYYALKICLNDFKRMSQGTSTRFLTKKILDNFEIQVPSLKTQLKIVCILDSITNKILNIQKINKNLDEICHLLFKYYFIDFIPFCNDRIINSEIGRIPKEWNIKNVGDILDCELGGTPSRSNESYWEGDIAWINSGKINEFRIIEPSEYITKEGLEKSATKLLPAKTTVIAITGATLGEISLLEINSCANQSVIGIVPNENYPYEFVYPLISSILPDLLKHQTGGAQQHINKNNVESFNIICPPTEVILEYKSIVNPLYSKISTNCFEIEKLTKLRDTLLSKLMSGEIDVSKINSDLECV